MSRSFFVRERRYGDGCCSCLSEGVEVGPGPAEDDECAADWERQRAEYLGKGRRRVAYGLLQKTAASRIVARIRPAPASTAGA
jgi:hypothetical protein